MMMITMTSMLVTLVTMMGMFFVGMIMSFGVYLFFMISMSDMFLMPFFIVFSMLCMARVTHLVMRRILILTIIHNQSSYKCFKHKSIYYENELVEKGNLFIIVCRITSLYLDYSLITICVQKEKINFIIKNIE